MKNQGISPKASIILSTYNAPHHLDLALTALERQSELNFELHIADDGSTAETAELIKNFQKRAPFPVIHSWQEDVGYRKTKILNEAIRKANADYLIFIDGDCIVHRDFVKHHLEMRENGKYLAGRRVDLGPKVSASITTEMVRRGRFDGPSFMLLQSCIEKDSTYFHRSFVVKNPALRKILKMERIDDLKGCNFSVDRESVQKINGFDEDYEGYAREDTDLEVRLQYLGLKIKSLKGLAVQYHVWHPRLPESEGNKLKLKGISTSRSAACKNGLVKMNNVVMLAFTLLAFTLSGCASVKTTPKQTVSSPAKFPHGFPIIDAHVHTTFPDANPPKKGLELPVKTEADLLSEFSASGVVAGIAHDFQGGHYYKDLRKSPLHIFHCAGIMNRVDEKFLRKRFKAGQYRCFKIYLGYAHYFPADPLYRPVYKLAREFHVPVVFHTGDTYDVKGKIKFADPLGVDEVAVDYPDVKFVIAHAGNPWIQSAAEVAYKNANVYLDISAFMIGDMNEQPATKVATYVEGPVRWIFGYVENPKKIMFGTDWPLTKIGPYVEAIKRSIPQEHWRAVFYDNAREVFGFEDIAASTP